MPEIAIQTDECVDVISKLNDEYDTLEMEKEAIEKASSGHGNSKELTRHNQPSVPKI